MGLPNFLLMRIILVFLFLLFLKLAQSQELLVNGDFEQENICTEYRVNCAPEGWISTSNGFSNYIKDVKGAYDGFHYMAIDAGSTNFGFRRTYLSSQLLCRLRKGNKYKIELHIRSRHPLLDSIGIYFTPYNFIFERASTYAITPAAYLGNARVKPQAGDTSWQKISIEYTATGLENFITIGNFSKRPITGSTGIPFENRFSVFVDGLSLRPLNRRETICTDWIRAKEEIYARNERHEFLERTARYYNSRNEKPLPPEMTMTSLPVIDTLVLPDIFFATGRSSLQPASHQLLDSFANKLTGRSIDSVVIEGNTDNTGSVQLNTTLSLARAEEVKRYILSKIEITEKLLIVRGNASTKNIATNNTAAGRQKNRRVDIYLYLR